MGRRHCVSTVFFPQPPKGSSHNPFSNISLVPCPFQHTSGVYKLAVLSKSQQVLTSAPLKYLKFLTLRSFGYSEEGYPINFTIDCLIPFLSQGNLSKITLRRWDIQETHKSDWNSFLSPCTIELELKGCEFFWYNHRHILSAFPALKSLFFEQPLSRYTGLSIFQNKPQQMSN